MKKSCLLFILFMLMIVFSLGACIKNDIQTFVYPIDLFMSGDVQNISESDLRIFEENTLKTWEKEGVCKSARINSERKVEVQYTATQLEREKKNIIEILKIKPVVGFVGSGDLTVAYSEDFTRLVVTGQESVLEEGMMLSQDIVALLMLQIMNGISCEDAEVVLELNYIDSNKKLVKELNCYNYNK